MTRRFPDIARGRPDRRSLPYAYQKLSTMRDGRELWLPLNRDYMPLGISGGAPVNHEEFAHLAVSFRTPPASLKGVWVAASPSPNPTMIWLFGDSRASRKGYEKRLACVEMATEHGG